VVASAAEGATRPKPLAQNLSPLYFARSGHHGPVPRTSAYHPVPPATWLAISNSTRRQPAIPGKSSVPGESLDYCNDVGLNKNMRLVLENLVAALKGVQQRVNAGQDV
jgi:hypothetical protein